MAKNNYIPIISIFTLLCALTVAFYIVNSDASSDQNTQVMKAVPILTDDGEDTGVTFFAVEEFSENEKAPADELSLKDSSSEKSVSIKIERELSDNYETISKGNKGKKIIRSLEEIAKDEMDVDFKDKFDKDKDKEQEEKVEEQRALADRKLNEELLRQGADEEVVDQLAAARNKMWELVQKNKDNDEFYKYKYKFTITPENGAGNPEKD